jgi:Na+-translocating ferredoxin:NAD+ oxidoreductase RnfA subunit
MRKHPRVKRSGFADPRLFEPLKGFLLAMVLFSGLRSRIDESNVPAPFKGLAVTLIAASFISLAFMGFAGIVDAIFA